MRTIPLFGGSGFLDTLVKRDRIIRMPGRNGDSVKGDAAGGVVS